MTSIQSDSSWSKNINYKLHLLLLTGQLLMENGADANRIIRDLRRVAAYMGITENMLNMHITYTTIILNVSDRDQTFTNVGKCYKHVANMDAIASVSRLTWKILENNLSLEEYEQALIEVQNRPRLYSKFLSCCGAGIACGALSHLFGGDIPAALCTFLCACIGFFLRDCTDKWEVNPYAGVSLATFVSTFFAWFMHFFSGSATPWHPMLACALFFIAGLPLINAVDDMLNNHIIAGLTRATDTLITVGSVTFGIILTIRLCHVSEVIKLSVMPENFYILQPLAACFVAIGYSLTFNVPKKVIPLAGLCAIICLAVRNFLNIEIGAGLCASTFAGAATVSIIALFATRYLKIPTHVLSIPSVTPLLPGVHLYRTLFALINIKSLSTPELLASIQTGVEAFLAVIGLAVGVAVPNLVARHYLDKEKRRHLKEMLG